MSNRWLDGDGPRGADYDRRFEALAATGADMDGEATLVASYAPRRVLDAGCGTGRVAIALAGRGIAVVGVDIDPSMLASARRKAPELSWVQGDLADPALPLGPAFDLVVLAGNVMIFVAPQTEGAVLEAMTAHLAPGGVMIAGYSLRPGGLTVETHDAVAGRVGLVLQDRWSTWDRAPFGPTSDYAVSVHRLPR
jgi:SAM-dependent methyltransferase